MGFFKASQGTASSKAIARLQALIWVLIYGGLLTLVLGLSVRRSSAAFGWSLVGAGGAVALAGVFLIYRRSTIREEP